jgi:hypothetical protein
MSDDKIKIGDRVSVFDPVLWGGTDSGDNSQFFKAARVMKVYFYRSTIYAGGDWVVDVLFDHRPQSISKAHFTRFITKVER